MVGELADLFPARDASLGEDDDAHVAVHLDGLGHAVGLARVVDVPRQPAAQRGVHHAPLVQAEHVDAAVLHTCNSSIRLIRSNRQQETRTRTVWPTKMLKQNCIW